MSSTTSTTTSMIQRLAGRPARPLALAVAAVMAASLVSLIGAAISTTPNANAATASAVLPFDMPSTATLRGSSKRVFAHYLPSLAVSLDNKDASIPLNDYYDKNYLTPTGEGGKHAAYGGYLRDRPEPRAVRTGTDWRVQDLKAEIRQAIDAGIDGFSLDILQMPGDSDTNVANAGPNMMAAAVATDPGFKIMLMPDMSASMANKTVEQWAAYLAQLGASSAAYRLSDGRLVVSPFKAEAWSVAKWTQLLDLMKTTYKMPVAFVPLFVGSEQTYASSFAPISYGMSNWGSRNPQWTDPTLTYSTSPVGRANGIRALGQKWMQPVSLQDARPGQGKYEEAENTQVLRNTWQIAMNSNAEYVQLVTWNDYGEGSQFAPSTKHGSAFLDVSSYYLSKYKSGTAPTITRDTVYVSHRTQFVATAPSYPQTKLMTSRGGTASRDTIEALTFLTAPGTVTVTAGATTASCQAPAGVSTCVVPLAVGTVKAAVTRSSATVASVTSGTPVTATPYVQDFQYVASSSGRQGGGASPAPTPTTASPTPTPTTASPTPTPSTTAPPAGPATVTTLFPTQDSYANQGAPSTNYGSSSSLMSRGTLGGAAYLRYAIPAPPAGKTLTKVALKVRTTSDVTAGSVSANQISIAYPEWTESSVTWAAQPDLYWALGSIAGGTAPNSAYEASLNVDAFNYVIGDSGTSANIAVTSTGTDSFWFWSRNHANTSYRPQLVLTYN